MRNYLKILAYGKDGLHNVFLSFFFLMIYTLFSAITLVSVIPFLEILFQTSTASVSNLQSDSWKAQAYTWLGNWVAQTPDKTQVLLWYCAALLLGIIIKNIGKYFGEYFMIPYEQGIIKNLRNHLFSHLTRLGLPFYTHRKKGEIIGLMVSDVQIVEESILSTVMNLVREPLTMLTFLIAMIVISWKMTLFTLLVLPITGLFLNFISKNLKRRAKSGQELLGLLTAILDEFISGIRVVKSFQKEAFESEKYQATNQAYIEQQMSFRRRVSLASPVTEVLSIIIVCIILMYGGTMILGGKGELKANEFIGFIALFSQFLLPIRNVTNGLSKVNKAAASFQRMQEILEIEPQIKEPTSPLPFTALQSAIRFEQVDFQYKDSPTLQGINLEIPKGKMIAIVGPSGGGKSTLADLIPRFYDVNAGKITIDGMDIRQISLYDLRKQMGYVAQEGVMFHDTIAANIAYGVKNPDRNKIQAAAKIAYADEFIQQLPQGYDTLIGERGTMLSGGQRQRIAIARAVFRNPEILILDEATSNLDTESEKAVQQALDALMQNRTSIVIAHRLSTILNADKIVVIEKGKMVEQGTHAELLQQNGLYKRLYELQAARND